MPSIKRLQRPAAQSTIILPFITPVSVGQPSLQAELIQQSQCKLQIACILVASS